MDLLKNKKSTLILVVAALVLLNGGLAYFLWGRKSHVASCELLLWARFQNEEIKLEQELWELAKTKCSIENVKSLAQKHCEAFKEDPQFVGVSAYLQIREPRKTDYKVILQEPNVCQPGNSGTKESSSSAPPTSENLDRVWQKMMKTPFKYTDGPQAVRDDRFFNLPNFSLKPQGRIEAGDLNIEIFNTGWVYLENPTKKISRYVYIPDTQWNTKPEALIFNQDRALIFTRYGQFYFFDQNLSLEAYWPTHTKVCGDPKVEGSIFSVCLTDIHLQESFEMKVDLNSGDLFEAKQLQISH